MGSIQQDPTILNIYAHNLGAPKYIKQLITNMKNLIDTMIVGDFDTPLISLTDHLSSRLKWKQ